MTPVDEAPPPTTGAFRAGTGRGTEGFFRAAQDNAGRWWLINPVGEPFFAKMVHGVRALTGTGDSRVAPDSAAQLRRWGFNAVGVGGDGAGRDDGLPFLATVDFCRCGAPIVAPGMRLPDVFAPDWPLVAAERALAVCSPLSGATALLGWVTDDEPGWAQPTSAGRPSLLQICLSLEPGFGTYHAAWEFALALHGGRLEALARAWGLAAAKKEIVRELTRAETGLVTRGYLRDDARWTREFARRYFATTAAAIRAADARHLVFGCRFDPALSTSSHLRQGFGGQAWWAAPTGPRLLAECVAPAVDVTMADWNAMLTAGAPPGPVLASNVSWASESFWRPTPLAATRLTSVERMLRRARAALDRTARHPSIVGYAWGQWQDEPGEQPPFARGLVHVNGAGAREHTELLTQFNARADSLRRAAPGSNDP